MSALLQALAALSTLLTALGSGVRSDVVAARTDALAALDALLADGCEVGYATHALRLDLGGLRMDGRRATPRPVAEADVKAAHRDLAQAQFTLLAAPSSRPAIPPPAPSPENVDDEPAWSLDDERAPRSETLRVGPLELSDEDAALPPPVSAVGEMACWAELPADDGDVLDLRLWDAPASGIHHIHATA